MNGNKKKLVVRVFIYGIGCFLLLLYLWICQRGYGIPCIIYENFSIVCPSCGATRAFIAILSGDIQLAISFHPIFTLAIYPVLAILLFQDFFIAVYRVIRKEDISSIIEFIFARQNKEAKK